MAGIIGVDDLVGEEEAKGQDTFYISNEEGRVGQPVIGMDIIYPRQIDLGYWEAHFREELDRRHVGLEAHFLAFQWVAVDIEREQFLAHLGMGPSESG
jgi:hypothetical protein